MFIFKQQLTSRKKTRFGADDNMEYHKMHWHANWCTAAVLIQQFTEDGLVKPKHVAIKCDFNDILKLKRDCERFVLH
jgi:hypothetical protein